MKTLVFTNDVKTGHFKDKAGSYKPALNQKYSKK